MLFLFFFSLMLLLLVLVVIFCILVNVLIGKSCEIEDLVLCKFFFVGIVFLKFWMFFDFFSKFVLKMYFFWF